MKALQVLIVLLTLGLSQSKPTTESTHDILKRLGFDLVQRAAVNHHNKRVALETKARYHNDFYNSRTDSRMYVVKLPPHSPYYSHMKPEKLKSEAASKPPMSFRTNGKPAQIYHWNIPVLRRTHVNKGPSRKNTNEDSRIYRIKILPKEVQKFYSRQESHKNVNKFKKHKFDDKLDNMKSNKNYRNKFYRFNDPVNDTTNGSWLAEELSDSQILNITMTTEKQGNSFHGSKDKNYIYMKLNDKYVNEVSKVKNKNHGPNYYVPAIPKQNSFYKYFTGNGKLKSFYVIEKNKKPSKSYRLL